MLRIVPDEAARAELGSVLDEIVRDGALRMLVAALEAEVDAYVAAAAAERNDNGHALVARNGKARPRTVVTGAGGLEVRAPRVNDRRSDEETGDKIRFKSEILPPWARKSPKVVHVLPLLYLHGLSTGDFVPALEQFFGTGSGLSASAITRLTTAWQTERDQFMSRKLADRDYVYMWVDGVHFNVRLGDDDRLCCLVMVGVRIDGTKELIAIAVGTSCEAPCPSRPSSPSRRSCAIAPSGTARAGQRYRGSPCSPRSAGTCRRSRRPPTGVPGREASAGRESRGRGPR